jgi:hypothetical protein
VSVQSIGSCKLHAGLSKLGAVYGAACHCQSCQCPTDKGVSVTRSPGLKARVGGVLAGAWVDVVLDEPPELLLVLPVPTRPQDPSVLHCPLLHSFSPVGQRACTVRVRVAVAS